MRLSKLLCLQSKFPFSLSLAWVLAMGLLPLSAPAVAAVPVSEQIAGALLAAPEGQREEAEVVGTLADGSEGILRQGGGELVCLADNAAKEGFEVACYHRSLAPFMARGRELRRNDVDSAKERNRIRWEEMEAGRLRTPVPSSTLHILSGAACDPEAGQVEQAYRRWVIYVPHATAESTGLPIKPRGSDPWLMVPGTPSAHIMITPARPE